jgi:hypothetical protein
VPRRGRTAILDSAAARRGLNHARLRAREHRAYRGAAGARAWAAGRRTEARRGVASPLQAAPGRYGLQLLPAPTGRGAGIASVALRGWRLRCVVPCTVRAWSVQSL